MRARCPTGHSAARAASVAAAALVVLATGAAGQRPVAFHLPGTSAQQFARIPNFNFPPAPFTVEGFINVHPDSQPVGRVRRFFFSYATRANNNCLLASSAVGMYGVWVHWAMTVDASNNVQHYVNGNSSVSMLSSRSWCGGQGGSLVIGHDQDTVGGGFDTSQATNMLFDSIRVHTSMLSVQDIAEISGGMSPGTSFYSQWCFSDPDRFGFDSGTSAQHFQIFGGGVGHGLATCGTTPSLTSNPLAFHLPGGTTSQYARALNYQFPPGPFTVEGFVKVGLGSGNRFMFSYAVNGTGTSHANNDNCLLVRSNVTVFGEWVHWAMTVDGNRNIQHYLGGKPNNSPRSSRTFCGVQGGSLVLGHDQDTVGGGLSAAQAPNIMFDGLRVHASMLSQQQISAIEQGGPPGKPLWSAWCFSNPDDFSIDSGKQVQPFEIYGGRAARGLSSCGAVTAIPASGPIALHLPGGTVSAYTSVTGFRFPVGGFTVEGWVKIARGSAGRYWFSYAAQTGQGSSNCLLVSSNMGTYGVWVHWAMTVDASHSIQHYVNGQANNGPRYSRTWCGVQDGSLVMGQDQDTHGGRFDPNQAPNMMIDSIRVHSSALSAAAIATIANGGSPGTTFWDSWCFSDPNNWGYDSGIQGKSLTVHGGRPAIGKSSCSSIATTRPVAFHLPGGSTTQYARIVNYSFPGPPFTVEGFINVNSESSGSNKYFFSYATSGNNNCLLAASAVGVYNVWVHWAMTVDASNNVQHYVNGNTTTSTGYSTRWCGVQGGGLAIGHDQDSVGGRFDANQSTNMLFDSLRVHNQMLTPDQIAGISGGVSSGTTFYDEWCFSDPDNFGYNSGQSGQHFEIFGGGVGHGLATCGTTPSLTSGPLAFHLPGGTTSQYARVLNYQFPPGPFTVEGFVKVMGGSGSRYMFSYAVNGTDNCLLARANVVTFGVWVHWAMTVNSTHGVQHYINGTVTSVPQWSSSWCGVQGGSLVIGHDQDTVGGGLNALQAPNIMFDGLRVHASMLSQQQLAAISNGGSPGSSLWSAWCFSNAEDFGLDSGTQNQHFDIYGGRAAVGLSTCGSATPIPSSGPIALHLPGGTISAYTAVKGFRFPDRGFTVEGWVKVARGSAGRYWFSYAAPPELHTVMGNCLLVSSNMGTYGVWVHWAMTVDANRIVTHYTNGVLNNGPGGPRYSRTWCGAQDGSLVLGQDQDIHGGGFNPDQAPNMMIDSIRIHAAVLTPSAIAAIANGGSPGKTFWDSWCFGNPQNFGADSGIQGKHFVVHGGRPAVGRTNCAASQSLAWWTTAPTPPPTPPTPSRNPPPGPATAGGGSKAAGMSVGVIIAIVLVVVVAGAVFKVYRRYRASTSRGFGYGEVNNPSFDDDNDDDDGGDKDSEDDEELLDTEIGDASVA